MIAQHAAQTPPLRARWDLISDGPDATQVGFAHENLRHMRAAIYLAQEMGAGLGRGQILLGSLPGRAGAVSPEN